MVEIKTGWSKESLKEYCKFKLFGKSKRNIILIVILGLIYLAVLTGCLVLFFAQGYTYLIIFAVLLTMLWGAGAFFIRSVMNTFVENAIKENEGDPSESIIVGESSILVCQSGEPAGEIKWDKITDIFFNDKAETIYLSAGENSVLILEKKNIVNGSMEELRKIAEGKKRECNKKSR